MVNSIIKITGLTIFLFLVSSCFKKKIEPETLKGKWEFTDYEFVQQSDGFDYDSINKRETISEKGYIEFTNSNLDQFKYVNGTFKLPMIFEDPLSVYYNNGKPSLFESDFYMETGGVYNSSHNLRDMYSGVVKNSSGGVLYESVTLKLKSKNKLIIMIGQNDINNTTANSLKQIIIELKKL